jgi:hypothetical protein
MRRFILAAVSVMVLSAVTAAQVPVPHEKFGDYPAPDLFPRQTGPAGDLLVASEFGSVQVNVDENGDDILGDAANEPSIAIDPTAPNRMVIGWRQFDNIQSNFRQAGYAWSNDGGRNWHFEGVLEPGTFGSDPVLESDSDGTFYYMTLHQTFVCYLFWSEDGGRTWSGGTKAAGGDKEWITIDKSGGIGDGNIYHVWSGNVGNRSTDSGLTFSNNRDFRAGNSGTLAVGPDGELFAASFFAVSRSDDAQDPGIEAFTFSKTTISLGGGHIYGADPNPGGGLGQAWIDVDRADGPARGSVYVLGTVAGNDDNDTSDVTFIRSLNGGLTWSQWVEVTGEPQGTHAWQWFGTMSVAPSGRIDVVWNDTLAGQNSWWSELRYSFSTDQGQSWSPPQVLSPQWSSQVGWPNQSKIGDYYDMESDLVGANLAWAATFTGGQDVYYLRIGDYDCNGNGVGDAQDLADGTAQDCDGDGIPDSCEIAAGAEADADGNGVPDSCESCYADFTGDGTLDLFDFLAYVNAFNVEDPSADCDDDGEFSLFDFLCFVNAFNEGC